MNNILTTEENEVLASFHLNKAENYLHEIAQDISIVNNKPDISLIMKRIEAFKREIEIAKFYNDETENTNENKS